MTSRSAPAALFPLVLLPSLTSQYTFRDALKCGGPLTLASNPDNGLQHQSGQNSFHHRINEFLDYGRKHVLIHEIIMGCLR